MWIKTTNQSDNEPVTRAITVPEIDERVVFNDSGKANVKKKIGRTLVREVESIVAVESDESEDSSDGDVEETSDESEGSSED
jgi:hypothetical protein